MNLRQKQIERAAAEGARKIDPQAGGFFRTTLERAFREGAEWADKHRPVPAKGDD